VKRTGGVAHCPGGERKGPPRKKRGQGKSPPGGDILIGKALDPGKEGRNREKKIAQKPKDLTPFPGENPSRRKEELQSAGRPHIPVHALQRKIEKKRS